VPGPTGARVRCLRGPSLQICGGGITPPSNRLRPPRLRQHGAHTPPARPRTPPAPLNTPPGVSSVKELLGRIRPYSSPEFHTALTDALAEVEADAGAAVPLDGASPLYKKFASKVQALAQQHRLPWQMLLSYQTKLAGADEGTRDALSRDYSAWLQAAQVQDVSGVAGRAGKGCGAGAACAVFFWGGGWLNVSASRGFQAEAARLLRTHF
jgi:hypothetical protein